MSRPFTWTTSHVGRRGAFLLFLAVLDFLYAGSLAHPAPEAARSPSTLFIGTIMPLWGWAALWGGVGLSCGIGAFLRHDKWAFSAAVALKLLWGGTFLLGWAIAGLDRGWVSAAVWLTFAPIVYLISGWSESPDLSELPTVLRENR